MVILIGDSVLGNIIAKANNKVIGTEHDGLVARYVEINGLRMVYTSTGMSNIAYSSVSIAFGRNGLSKVGQSFPMIVYHSFYIFNLTNMVGFEYEEYRELKKHGLYMLHSDDGMKLRTKYLSNNEDITSEVSQLCDNINQITKDEKLQIKLATGLFV